MELKEIVATNLVKLRKNAGFTQIELAEKLNYSDKAVSKWERGESLPDLETLKRIADLYHVSLDSLVNEKINIIKQIQKNNLIGGQKFLISVLSVILVWIIATIVFTILYWCGVGADATYSFIVALPVTFIVILVFNSVWGKLWGNFISTSALLWTIALCVYLPINTAADYLCFIIPIPVQIGLFIFYGLKHLNNSVKSKRQKEIL
ncbi:MAG: helix-turn-helix transcriptional regulator [Clostridia bacterium]|nr:helix-turn-helix transcriptional regulator [Clostridia bacterium]